MFNSAELQFQGRQFGVFSGAYVPIKAHSFAEVEFKAAGETNGGFLGSWRTDEEPVIKIWSDLVKAGKEIPFKLAVTMSDNKVAINGIVRKE